MDKSFFPSFTDSRPVTLSRVTLQALLRGYARLGRRPGIGRARARRWLRMVSKLLRAEEGVLILVEPMGRNFTHTLVAHISPELPEDMTGDDDPDHDEFISSALAATQETEEPAVTQSPLHDHTPSGRRDLRRRSKTSAVSSLADAIVPAFEHLILRPPPDSRGCWDLSAVLEKKSWLGAEAVRRHLELLQRQPPLVSVAAAPWARPGLSSLGVDVIDGDEREGVASAPSASNSADNDNPSLAMPVTLVAVARSASDPAPPPNGADLLHVCHMAAAAMLFPPLPAEQDRIQRLTPGERQTLHLLLAGRSEKQVATELDRSRHTIHSHIKRIYKNLGVATRAELLASFSHG